ncbi:MAG: 4Fe-4S ferredoxin, partial [Phascolarctobacterium sp.]|nr:4Fe-4S ferredoxin [Phascolarctobacterium sp.]
YCDCHGENDAPIVADIGMLASFDPVALDQACVDLVCAAPPMPNSVLGEAHAKNAAACEGHDHFHNTSPDSEWKMCLEHAEKIGLGTREYELVKI